MWKEKRANKYWVKDQDRVCRICSNIMETLEHILKESENIKEETKGRRHWLNRDGRGTEWMKKVKRAREEAERRRNL